MGWMDELANVGNVQTVQKCFNCLIVLMSAVPTLNPNTLFRLFCGDNLTVEIKKLPRETAAWSGAAALTRGSHLFLL